MSASNIPSKEDLLEDSTKNIYKPRKPMFNLRDLSEDDSSSPSSCSISSKNKTNSSSAVSSKIVGYNNLCGN